MGRYKYNRDQLKFTEERATFFDHLKRAVNVFFSIAFLFALFYLLFYLFFNTEDEKKLLQEKRAIEREYAKILEKSELLNAVVENLGERDRNIYGDIFDAAPPAALFSMNPGIVEYRDDIAILQELGNISNAKVSVVEQKVNEAKSIMSEIIELIRDTSYNSRNIPIISPIADMAISQAGASIGEKIHPFYKTKTMHKGLDIISVVGTKVIATADGTVKSVARSDAQKGNYIEIDNSDGYVTRYMHLSDMYVRRGQKIKRGDIIALVGVTGQSFAPHLHYEVEYNGKIMNPVDYMFAHLGVYDYAAILLISYNTGQSLD